MAARSRLRDVLDVAAHRRSGTVVVDLTAAGFVGCRAAALMVEAGSALGDQDRGLEHTWRVSGDAPPRADLRTGPHLPPVRV